MAEQGAEGIAANAKVAARIAQAAIFVYRTQVDLIRELTQQGWRLVHVRGSHHMFAHPDRRGRVVVPHPKKDLGVGLVAAIRRQAWEE